MSSNWVMTVPGDWRQPGITYREKRSRYYCSREWGILKEAVRERCGGTCERCKARPMYAVHHQTYERMFREELDDLLGVCDECHEFMHGRRGEDPADVAMESEEPETAFAEGDTVIHPHFGIGRITRIWSRPDESGPCPGMARADIAFAVGPQRSFVISFAPLKLVPRKDPS